MNKSVNESFEVHNCLNKKLFGEDNKILPEVRKRLVEIVKYFEDFVKVPLHVCDVQLVGSNVGYSYTSTSDLDVHIIVNFDATNVDKDILQALYDSKKKEFNDLHDISVRGIPVEIFIQDVNSTTISNGIYSICDNEWVKEPKPMKSATKHNTEKELDKWREIIKNAVLSENPDVIDQTINALYLIRHNSLAVDGEFGKGNQLYKDIRSEGLIQRLKNASYEAHSKELTMECYSKGQLVNRYEGVDDDEE